MKISITLGFENLHEANVDTSNPYRIVIRNPKAIGSLPENLKKELVPPPNPVLSEDKHKYLPFDRVFKTELSKKTPVLPVGESGNKTDKKLKPGFQLKLDSVRNILTCSDCGLPRLVYSKYKLSGNGSRDLVQILGQIESERA